MTKNVIKNPMNMCPMKKYKAKRVVFWVDHRAALWVALITFLKSSDYFIMRLRGLVHYL